MRRFILLFLLLLGTGSWVGWRSYCQQQRLHQQLAQLTAVLSIENDRVTQEGQGIIKGIETATAKNRNQPADVALLRRAEGLQACVDELVASLRSSGGQLRRATGNPGGNLPLRHLGAAITAGPAWGQGAPRRRAIERLVATYVDTLYQLSPALATALPLQVPALNQATPVAEALADLSQLESAVLARQALALQRLAKSMGARRWLTHPLVTATAASNVVAPGATYCAQLGLTGYFSANEVRMQLTCNGRPVPTGPAGTGLVRFRAPNRPGPATWTGTIRLNQNGRDTTFKVTVPYRVVRR